ncbi:Eco57I restriction-modification methylase domain-containing protein [Candidatus Chloroploca sp. Khr17]|uniref:Eco57I restriction-modification methylase domain-containing protein n=1 Tax=Candidatus Chloroploca sp. Khr17 TaxID=2496869 RepID=UPI00101D30CA|nr:Eco57I restriction-modification methylase domain-containing protein [Candidatus Chloroploca sp. Khr17]
MSAAQLSLALAQRHHNRQLFADRYLDVTLPQREEWLALRAEAMPVLAQVQALLAAFTPSNNEAQTEHDLVRPVLLALGHSFEVQAALRTPKGTKKPDYVFYRDQAALNANKGRVLTEADLGAAFAVGDAKHWERKLDVSSTGEGDEINKVPADQIAFYMRHSGVAWGVLTNGRFWRLYHKDTVHKQDRFYEVDLRQLVEAGDVDAFLYFYAFFRRAAFNPAATEPLALEAMLRESSAYARGVSESLKAQVFDALRHLAQGLLDYPGNRLEPTPETLREVYSHSLIVLYRLLFIFYAEARELLPLRASASYREDYSLAATVRQVVRRLDSGLTLLADTGRTWARLRDLFQIINGGSPPLQVATFNGGLFDPQRHPFLERYTIGDAQLQRALDKLARVNKEQIDYRDLAERHLGTIYEGLLEYHLQPIAPTSDGFTLDLFNDKGERHRTGSYYTPDFVVQYIVEQTLRPLLDAAVAGQTTDEAKIAAVLAVNCLDPAMGSGHFPVAATEYIARYLVELGVQPPAEAGEEPDLVYWKRRVAQSCIYGVDLNPLAVDLAKLSLWLATAAKGRPLSFLDHHLRCGNALVGSRATEVAVSKPVKPAKRSKKELAAAQAGQLSMLEDPAFAGAMSSAVGSMWLIEGSAGRTVAEVKEQEQLYELIRRELTERFAVQADLRTADDFAQAPDQSLWPSLLAYASKRESGAFAMPAYEPLLAQVRALAEAQRFLHWDLEFPEVFFDRHGRPLGEEAGFDAIIGNPPYVRQEQLGPLKPYLQRAYPETYSGTADLFVFFFHQGVKLLRQGGRLGYIASNSWLRANYATPLRSFMREQVTVEQLIDLGDNRVFADAPDVYPAIPLVRKATPPHDHTAQVATFNRGEGVRAFATQVAAKLTLVSIHDQQDTGWQLGDGAGRQLLAKLVLDRKPLGSAAKNAIYRGVLTGLNEAFIIDQVTYDRIVETDPASTAVLKPFLRGEDLRPWYQEAEGRWLILLPNKWTGQTFGPGLNEAEAWVKLQALYPGIAAHLKPFAADARKRGDKGEYWWELRPCDYYDAFGKTKVFYPELAKQPRFSWDDTGAYVNNKGFIIPTEQPWLVGLLNSRTIWFLIMRTALGLGERAGMERFQLFAQFISRLPIPDATAAERDIIGDLAMQITAEAQARYTLHQRARRRILSDLGGAPGTKLNQKLTAWWTLDFPAFRTEVHKALKREIALKERDDWQDWLDTQRAAHAAHTAAIIAGETALNARVYQLFDLSADEIALIEASTKYHYGEE